MSTLPLFRDDEEVKPVPLPLQGGWAEPVTRLVLKGQWVELRIIRSARRRTLSLTLDQKGLKAQAPTRMSEAKILDFVREKSEWTLARLAEFEERQKILTQPIQLWVLGQAFRLAIINPHDPTHPKASGLDVLRCTFWHHEHEEPKESARIALMALAEKEIAKRLPSWAGRMGLALPRWRMSRAESRWGSCSLETGLRFSWKLGAVFPMLMDYVIVHELAHLRHMNHSPRFWKEVEKYYPSWNLARNQLREFELKLSAW